MCIWIYIVKGKNKNNNSVHHHHRRHHLDARSTTRNHHEFQKFEAKKSLWMHDAVLSNGFWAWLLHENYGTMCLCRFVFFLCFSSLSLTLPNFFSPRGKFSLQQSFILFSSWSRPPTKIVNWELEKKRIHNDWEWKKYTFFIWVECTKMKKFFFLSSDTKKVCFKHGNIVFRVFVGLA